MDPTRQRTAAPVVSRRRSAAVPYACAALNVLASLAMACWLRGGLEVAGDPAARIVYIQAHLFEWRIGWGIWVLAAFSLVAFFAWWGARVKSHDWSVAALAVAVTGLGFDWAAEAVYIGWFPDRMLTLGRAAALLTGAAGNGLYSVAGMVLLWKSPMIKGVVRWWGWAVWTTGLCLAVATAQGNAWAMSALTAVLMVLFCPWVAVAGRQLR